MRIAAQPTRGAGRHRPHLLAGIYEEGAGALASASIASPMPKMKTHSGAKKRFRKTATGKLRGRRAYSSHILEKKSPKRKRKMARPVEISKNDAPTVRALLGGGKKR
jgi:large subunit ribosomal protein L35